MYRFRLQDLAPRAWDCLITNASPGLGLEFRVQGSGFMVQRLGIKQGLGVKCRCLFLLEFRLQVRITMQLTCYPTMTKNEVASCPRAASIRLRSLNLKTFTLYKPYLPGIMGKPTVNLFHNIRIIQGLYYPRRLKVTYSTTRSWFEGMDVSGSGLQGEGVQG